MLDSLDRRGWLSCWWAQNENLSGSNVVDREVNRFLDRPSRSNHSIHFYSSYISGISLLGTPTEIYVHGTQFFFIIGGLFFMGFGMMYVFLPVFHDLKLTSTYQYLQQRFDNRIRLFGSILFTLAMVSECQIEIFFHYCEEQKLDLTNYCQ